MPFRDNLPEELKVRERRRGVRVNSRVPVVVEMEMAAGQAERLEGHTRIVGPYGCLVVLPHPIDLEQRMKLTNLATQRSNEAMIVWKGKERTEGWEFGVELFDPPMDFWGLDL